VFEAASLMQHHGGGGFFCGLHPVFFLWEYYSHRKDNLILSSQSDRPHRVSVYALSEAVVPGQS